MPTEPPSPEAAREFGRQLLKARKRRGYSQQELGEAADLTREHISRLERGVSNDSRQSAANPTMEVLLELSRALGMQLRIDQTRPGHGLIIEFVDPE